MKKRRSIVLGYDFACALDSRQKSNCSRDLVVPVRDQHSYFRPEDLRYLSAMQANVEQVAFLTACWSFSAHVVVVDVDVDVVDVDVVVVDVAEHCSYYFSPVAEGLADTLHGFVDRTSIADLRRGEVALVVQQR